MSRRASIMTVLLYLTCNVYLTSAATHSLQYVYTGVTPGINIPEFTTVGMVDGKQINHYDSQIREVRPKTEWMEKVTAADPDYWNRNTLIAQRLQETFKDNLATVMKRFNQTKGVHVMQMMVGCELHDDGTKRGYTQYGYDGEDFISLDLNTLTWTASSEKAVITKHKLDATGANAAQQKNYLENICIEWLQKYVGYGRDTLERKVPPEVSVFQKDSSSPVVCHATGFFPKEVMISWQKDGEDLYEDVELRETLLNPDGTFQKRSILNISPEKLDNTYTCVVKHSSLKTMIVLNAKYSTIHSSGGSFGIIIGAVVAVLLVTLIAAGLWSIYCGRVPII